jgi:flagellar biosynthesis/type III secretory pathway protein FliH
MAFFSGLRTSAARGTSNQHMAETCEDEGCQRLPCRMFHAGYRKGHDRGYREGYARGWNDGYAAGYAAGLAAGSKG